MASFNQLFYLICLRPSIANSSVLLKFMNVEESIEKKQFDQLPYNTSPEPLPTEEDTHPPSRYTSFSSLLKNDYHRDTSDEYQKFMWNRKESLITLSPQIEHIGARPFPPLSVHSSSLHHQGDEDTTPKSSFVKDDTSL